MAERSTLTLDQELDLVKAQKIIGKLKAKLCTI